MTWRKRRDRKGVLVEWRERLSNGRVLSFAFSVNNSRSDRSVCFIYPHLIVHRPFMRRHTWRYAGLPTGPGGTEVFARVIALWDEGIEQALALTPRPYVEVQVEAESPRLFAIYSHFLTRHGYHIQPAQYEERDFLWRILRNDC